MNRLEGGPATVVSNRLMGHALRICLHTTQKECEDGDGGGVVSLANPPPLMVVVTECGMCGGFFGARAAGLCGSLRV